MNEVCALEIIWIICEKLEILNYIQSHADIRDAILTLVGAVREQTGKLERHELRERQLGDALTRSLGQIDSRARGQDKNLENLAILMARIDERLRKMEEMIIQVQRINIFFSGFIQRLNYFLLYFKTEGWKREDPAAKDYRQHVRYSDEYW